MGKITCNHVKTNRLHGIPEPLAILGFVSTLAFAQYIGAKNKSAPEPKAKEDAA